MWLGNCITQWSKYGCDCAHVVKCCNPSEFDRSFAMNYVIILRKIDLKLDILSTTVPDMRNLWHLTSVSSDHPFWCACLYSCRVSCLISKSCATSMEMSVGRWTAVDEYWHSVLTNQKLLTALCICILCASYSLLSIVTLGSTLATLLFW